MAATTADLAKKFIDLDLARKAKEVEVKAMKKELDELEKELLTRFENAEVQSQKIAGVTLFTYRQLWAKSVEGNKERAVWALKQSGLQDFVSESFNSQTLSAWIREQVKEAEARRKDAGVHEPMSLDDIMQGLPGPLMGAIELTEQYELRTRQG